MASINILGMPGWGNLYSSTAAKRPWTISVSQEVWGAFFSTIGLLVWRSTRSHACWLLPSSRAQSKVFKNQLVPS